MNLSFLRGTGGQLSICDWQLSVFFFTLIPLTPRFLRLWWPGSCAWQPIIPAILTPLHPLPKERIHLETGWVRSVQAFEFRSFFMHAYSALQAVSDLWNKFEMMSWAHLPLFGTLIRPWPMWPLTSDSWLPQPTTFCPHRIVDPILGSVSALNHSVVNNSRYRNR